MTQDEIIQMAKESGAVERYFGNQLHGIAFHKKEWLKRFADLVAAHERASMWCDAEFARQQEREACAKVCEDDMGWLDNGGGELCAKAIRARGEE